MTLVVWALVGLAVAAALFGALAFHRLRTPIERLHAGSFVTVATTAPLVLAGFATEGVTSRTLKLAALFALLLVSGALANHAIARALLYRGGEHR